MKTQLTQEDKDLIWANNWRLKELKKAVEDDAYLLDLIEDSIEANHEILDFSNATHIDKGALPDPSSPKQAAPSMMKGSGKTIIIYVGHNENTGARSLTGFDEWTSRNSMCLEAAEILKRRGYNVIVAYRDGKLGYTSAMKKHGEFSRKHNAVVSVECHFNIANGVAQGSEIIVASQRTQDTLGRCFGEQLDRHYPGYTKRGNQNGARLSKGGRGFAFNKYQPCASGIYEPFFADTDQWYNHDESNEISSEALFLADTLDSYVKNHT